MRPPEQNASIVLYELQYHSTEDTSDDEPYMWILGFKVDADTLGGGLIPSLGVQVFENVPASPWTTVLGP